MKIRYILPLFVSTVAFSATFVEVTGDNVNLRSAAGLSSDVVGQVSSGDLLELQGNIEDAWVKVTPPQSVDLWVAGQYVENGVIIGNRVRVRAGASINHKDVGIVEKGTKVDVRGNVGDWIKIAPPKTTSVWITNAYVKATGKVIKNQQSTSNNQQSVVKKTTEQKPVVKQHVVNKQVVKKPVEQKPVVKQPTDTKQPVVKQPAVKKTTQKDKQKTVRRTFFGSNDSVDNTPIGPAKIPQSRLRDDCKQAARGSYTGRLEVSPKNAPARFRLVRDVPGSRLAETECYIIGNTTQLKSIVGQSFTFEGPVYWFKGTSIPTVYTQAIIRVR